jgi:hypothetical protein
VPLFMRRTEVIVLLLLSIVPLLWFAPGHIIAKGDYSPYIFNIENFKGDSYLWSSNNLGKPSSLPAYYVYGILWASSQLFLVEIGLWQIILCVICFAGAAFSMFYLAKTVYSEGDVAIIASIFYVFNFSILVILLNIGMIWTYAFLPLLIALFIKTLTQEREKYRHVVYFAVAFTTVASVSSINFADIGLIFISLASIFLYYIIFDRKVVIKKIGIKIAVLSIVTFLVSTWWIIPVLNYYLFSPSTQLQQEVAISSWSWTHARASFLNLFMLNGGWGWRPEYVPYYYLYSDSAILTVLLFIPLLLASSALLFKDEKRKLNAYLMLIILIFVFLAKGLHEPLSSVNLFLYNYVPYMDMFREPISKFTLIMIPFLALLIGYSAEKIAKTLKPNIVSKLFITGVILILIVSAFPIITNPVETKTEEIPFSSYIQIPQYWYEANNWLNNKAGDYRILITPLDDYYQVPYSWGYYGADSFLERLVQDPIISPCYAFSYAVNPNAIMLMNQLRDAIKYNRTEEFETIMKLMNVKYILQRNDLDYKYMASTNRDMLNPEKMRNFLSNQQNITLDKTLGELDIYEYTQAQPYVHTFESKQPQEYNVEIENKTILNLQWNFNSTNQLDEWRNTTLDNQFGTVCKIYSENETLKFELWNSTWGWKTINSPLTTARYDAQYSFRLGIKGENAQDVHIKIFEYNKNMEIVHSEYVYYVADGTFDWKDAQINYTPKNESTTSIQLSIWNGHETNKPFPNTIWIDNVEIQAFITKLTTTNIQQALQTSTENPPAAIIEYKKLNPTKITVKVNASQPFILAINEAHDQNWKAHLNGKTYDSIPIFSVMNGFQINETGLLDVVIEYEPQNWFYIGCAISITTFLACTAYLAYSSTKTRNLFRKLKQKLIHSGN